MKTQNCRYEPRITNLGEVRLLLICDDERAAQGLDPSNLNQQQEQVIEQLEQGLNQLYQNSKVPWDEFLSWLKDFLHHWLANIPMLATFGKPYRLGHASKIHGDKYVYRYEVTDSTPRNLELRRIDDHSDADVILDTDRVRYLNTVGNALTHYVSNSNYQNYQYNKVANIVSPFAKYPLVTAAPIKLNLDDSLDTANMKARVNQFNYATKGAGPWAMLEAADFITEVLTLFQSGEIQSVKDVAGLAAAIAQAIPLEIAAVGASFIAATATNSDLVALGELIPTVSPNAVMYSTLDNIYQIGATAATGVPMNQEPFTDLMIPIEQDMYITFLAGEDAADEWKQHSSVSLNEAAQSIVAATDTSSPDMYRDAIQQLITLSTTPSEYVTDALVQTIPYTLTHPENKVYDNGYQSTVSDIFRAYDDFKNTETGRKSETVAKIESIRDKFSNVRDSVRSSGETASSIRQVLGFPTSSQTRYSH